MDTGDILEGQLLSLEPGLDGEILARFNGTCYHCGGPVLWQVLLPADLEARLKPLINKPVRIICLIEDYSINLLKVVSDA